MRLSPFKMCAFHTWTDEFRKQMADETSRFLYEKLRADGTKDWIKKRLEEGSGSGDGQSGVSCTSIQGRACMWKQPCRESYAKNWWIMSKVTNFLSMLGMMHAAAEPRSMNTKHISAAIMKALPANGKLPKNLGTYGSLLATFGNGFGVVGADGPAKTAELGIASAVLGVMEGSGYKTEEEFQQVETALDKVLESYKMALTHIPFALLTNGDINDWPLGARQSRVSCLQDGRKRGGEGESHHQLLPRQVLAIYGRRHE